MIIGHFYMSAEFYFKYEKKFLEFVFKKAYINMDLALRKAGG